MMRHSSDIPPAVDACTRTFTPMFLRDGDSGIGVGAGNDRVHPGTADYCGSWANVKEILWSRGSDADLASRVNFQSGFVIRPYDEGFVSVVPRKSVAAFVFAWPVCSKA